MGWLNINGNWIGRHSGKSWSSYWLTRNITGLTITVDSDTQFTLNWTNNGVADYTGHKAYVSTDNITFTLNKTVASIGTSMALTGLTPGTLYYAYVLPYKGSNDGTASNTAVDITTATSYINDAGKVAWFLPNYADMTMNAAYQISQWNDLSGNGNHLTNADSDSKKPILSTQGVTFGRSGTKSRIFKSLTYGQPEYIYLVLKIHALKVGSVSNTICDGAGASNRCLLTFAPTANATNWLMTSGTVVDTGFAAADCVGKPKIFRLIYNGAASKMKIMAAESADLNANTQAANCILLGNNYLEDDATYGQFQLIEAIYKSSSANEANIYNYLYNKYFANRSLNIVWEGHSMINPLEIGTDIALPDHTLLWLKKNHQILTYPTTNIAVGGAVIGDMVTRKAAYLTPYFDSTIGLKNVVVIFIGTNDVSSTLGSGAAAYTALKTYVDGVITDGWTPVVITMTKATTDAQREVERNVYNDAIKANADWDYVLDVDMIPELADVTDTDYYNADTVHLVNGGNLILGEYLAAKIAEIP